MSPQTQFSRLFLSLVLVSFINAYLFIFGCPRYSLFCLGFLHLVAARGGYSLVVVCGLLTEVAALAVAHRLRNCGSRAPERRLNSCDACTLLIRDAWNLPGSGIEPVSPAVAGRFFITEPPGKPHLSPHFFFFAMMIGGISV